MCTFFKWCKLLQLDLQYNASHFAKRFCQALAVHPLLITFCLYHFANFIVFLIFILLTQNSKVKHSTKITHLLLCTLIDWTNHLIQVYHTMIQSCESWHSKKNADWTIFQYHCRGRRGRLTLKAGCDLVLFMQTVIIRSCQFTFCWEECHDIRSYSHSMQKQLQVSVVFFTKLEMLVTN